MAIGPALIGAGASIIGGLLGHKGQSDTNKANQREAQLNRQFQERMRNTEWQAAVADMEAAGLNPALAYSQGGASSPSGAQARLENPHADTANNARQAVMHGKTLKLMDAQIEKARGEAESAAAKGEIDQWRTRASKMFMDWDGDGESEMWIKQSMQQELALQRYQMNQARNLSEISGTGANLAGAARPYLNQFRRGTDAISRGLNLAEKATPAEIWQAYQRLYFGQRLRR